MYLTSLIINSIFGYPFAKVTVWDKIGNQILISYIENNF